MDQDTLLRIGAMVLTVVLAVIIVGITSRLYHNAVTVPSQPNGSPGRDYTVPRTGTLDEYLTAQNRQATNTRMRDLTVATATFGGIFTEDIGALTPYIGTVSPDAARLQIGAGARALVIDIWPDPADMAMPVVCAMKDDSTSWWSAHGGLNRGTGRYSNWKMLTRNKVRAGTMLTAAVDAATNSSTNPQWNDPFFLVLCLHGAMTKEYLNTLAADLSAALNGKGIAATARPGVLNTLCNATADQFQGKVCVIVCPDIQPGFQSLPNVNTFQQFVTAYSATNMMNYTNILQTQPNTVIYSPESIASLTQDTAQPCDVSGTGTVPPPRAGFCVVQPSTGGSSSKNADLFANGSYSSALQTGAQFVAANLFSSATSDDTLGVFFAPNNFGTYSFRLNSTS